MRHGAVFSTGNTLKYFILQHILINGLNALQMPTQVTQVHCLPAPANGTAHGIRIRISCNLKASHTTSCTIRDPRRYHWITPSTPVLKQLHLAPDQYRPALSMLWYWNLDVRLMCFCHVFVKCLVALNVCRFDRPYQTIFRMIFRSDSSAAYRNFTSIQ